VTGTTLPKCPIDPLISGTPSLGPHQEEESKGLAFCNSGQMIKDDDRARLLARGRNLELMTLGWNQGERQSLSVKARGVRALG
jgi:hypothetical protein